jgi:SHS family lactate transporter-like MFS transporter
MAVPSGSSLSTPKPRWLMIEQVGYLAWTWDAFDYFSVSQVIKELAEQWGKSNIAIAVGLTVSLIPRFLGAAIFGLAADRFGRKWPFVVNCALLVILEMAIGFCNNYNQFVICRTLFGIAMGGLYGNATATALEDCPERARGLVSGIFQSGYAMGWLLATAFTKCFVDISQDRWRPLFWFGAGPPVLLIILRVWLPERAVYKAQNGASNDRDNIRGFFTDFNAAVSRHWRLLAYLVAFMTGCSFLVSYSLPRPS